MTATLHTIGIAGEALRFATFTHGGQVDKQGMDYMLHPERVGQAVAHLGEVHEAVGYLHDTKEDQGVTDADLRAIGMPEAVIEAVDAISKRPDEKGTPGGYARFIARVALNPIAREVKIADIRDNMRPGGTESLYRRYRKALAALGATERLN
jgi:(p)ppGpp synthase/HD superfamily hydrolase